MDRERRHPVLDPLAVYACHELAVARPQAPQPYGDPGGSRRDTVTGPLRPMDDRTRRVIRAYSSMASARSRRC
jgi:hypothetical protein